jgi:hypothetical protein
VLIIILAKIKSLKVLRPFYPYFLVLRGVDLSLRWDSWLFTVYGLKGLQLNTRADEICRLSANNKMGSRLINTKLSLTTKPVFNRKP